jgi:signal transduction histidine kinase
VIGSGRTRGGVRIFWKLLLPFLALVLVLGLSGTYLTVRYLTAQAQQNLDQVLSRRSVFASSYLSDETLYLIESVRFAANIEGLAEAAERRDAAAAKELVASVPALRTQLDLLVVTDRDGTGLVEYRRSPTGLDVGSGTFWRERPLVDEVLSGVVDAAGDKRAGLLRADEIPRLAVAGPVTTTGVVGSVMAGISAQTLAAQARERTGAGGVALFDRRGGVIGLAGNTGALASPPRSTGTRTVRRLERSGGREIATLYAPFELRGERLGTLAVSQPTRAAFADVRGAGLKLAAVLAIAMALVFAVGALLSRSIVRRIEPLVQTHRALGRGDLSARAPVLARDELSELAIGINQMAEELEASHAQLEMRVEERTEELQRISRQLAQANKTQADFFAGVSHEFRTPLFAILGHAEMLQDPEFHGEGRGWRREFGETIQKAGEDLLARVNDILDLARLDAGGMDVELSVVGLRDVMSDLHGTAAALARRAGIELSMVTEEGLPSVWADPARLKQILMNLISNAVAYTPAGGRVDIEASTGGSTVEVNVADTGVGIPRDVGTKIFEPFYRVKGTSTQHGEAATGLGLALTKRWVQAHGGEIWFRSRPGAGTTFTFALVRGDSPRPFGSRAARRR